MTVDMTGYTHVSRDRFEEIVKAMKSEAGYVLDSATKDERTIHHHSVFTTPIRAQELIDKFELARRDDDYPNAGFGTTMEWVHDDETGDVIEFTSWCGTIGTDWRMRLKNVPL